MSLKCFHNGLFIFLSFCLLPLGCKAKHANESKSLEDLKDSAGCDRYIGSQSARLSVPGPGVSMPFAIIGLNDLHGYIESQTITLKSNQKERKVTVGGFQAIAAYFQAICKAYEGRVLFLDAGDSYVGTLVSDFSHGQAVLQMFNALGLHASTFGNHEFDKGLSFLKSLLDTPRLFAYLSANIVDNQGQLPWSGYSMFEKSKVFQVGPAKIGVVGYTTVTTPQKSFPQNVSGLNFLAAERVIDEQVKQLRKNGADFVVLLAHAGGRCDMSRPPEEGDTACIEPTNEINTFLRSSQSVDAVFGGHTHNAQRHFVRGVPIMQTTGHGLSASWLHIELNMSASVEPLGHQDPLKKGQNRIAQILPKDPIFFCHEHFKDYSSCNPRSLEWSIPYPDSVFINAQEIAPNFLGFKVDFESQEVLRLAKKSNPTHNRREKKQTLLSLTCRQIFLTTNEQKALWATVSPMRFFMSCLLMELILWSLILGGSEQVFNRVS